MFFRDCSLFLFAVLLCSIYSLLLIFLLPFSLEKKEVIVGQRELDALHKPMKIEDQIGAITCQFVVGTALLCEVLPAFSLDAIAIQAFEWLSIAFGLFDGCL